MALLLLGFAIILTQSRAQAPGHEEVFYADFSRDGQWLVVVTADVCRIHRLPSHEVVADLPIPFGPRNVVFSPCSKYLAIVGAYKKPPFLNDCIEILELTRPKAKLAKKLKFQINPKNEVLDTFAEGVAGLTFSDDSTTIFTVHPNGLAKAWRWKEETQATSTREFTREHFSYASSMSRQNVLIFPGKRADLWEFDRFPPRLRATVPVLPGGGYAYGLDDGSFLVSGFPDGPTRVYEVTDHGAKLIREVPLRGYVSVTRNLDMAICRINDRLAFFPLIDAKRKELGLKDGQSHARHPTCWPWYDFKSEDDRWLLVGSDEFRYRAVEMQKLLKESVPASN